MTGHHPPYHPNITTVRYDLQRFHADLVFDPSVLRAMTMEQWDRTASADLVYRLMGVVAMWKEERVLKVPANWWQHFKQRFFPVWALKRWPVLYQWYDAGVVLPKVPVVDPKYHTVEFPVWSKSDMSTASKGYRP